MNTLGRLLIVLIFIGSIVFMSFSVVLYVTHTNWKTRAEELQKSLDAKETAFKAMEIQKTAMEAAMNLDIQRKADAIAALKETTEQLTVECQDAKQNLENLENIRQEENTAMLAAHETAARQRIRLDETSRALYDAQNQWVDMSTQLITKTDEVQSLALQLTVYQSVCSQLAKDYKDAVEVLRKHGLSADPELYTSKPPAGISGTVTEVRPRGIVEISLGSDSGLIKGHQLDVVRHLEGRSSYVGKIEITDIAPDKSVARVMPEFRRGVVQRGDEIKYIDINELSAH